MLEVYTDNILNDGVKVDIPKGLWLSYLPGEILGAHSFEGARERH